MAANNMDIPVGSAHLYYLFFFTLRTIRTENELLTENPEHRY